MPDIDIDIPSSFIKLIDLSLQGALFTKFESILKLDTINNGIINFPSQIALREIAEKRGNVELEFINVWRTSTAPDWNRMRTPAARRGLTMDYTDANKTAITWIKTVPAKLEYEVCFWTQYQERLNLITERYLFWQQETPNLDIDLTVSYDSVEFSYPTKLQLHFGPLVDESNIEEKFEKGQIFKLKVLVTVDGFVFVSDSVKTIKTIYFTVYDKDSLSTTADYSEVIVEDSNQDAELEIALKLFTRIYT